MSRLAAVMLAGSLGGCATPSPEAPPPLPPPEASLAPTPAASAPPRATPFLEHVLGVIGRSRGLTPKHPVPGVVLARKDLLARVKEHVRREVPEPAIRAEGLVQKLLGLFPTGDDYEAATYALLEGQLAGYYEPADGTMYVANDLDESNASLTLAHELVHALQDQYWDLKVRSAYVAGEDDHDAAFSGLAEGDATLAAADLEAERLRPGATALDLPDGVLERALLGARTPGRSHRTRSAWRSWRPMSTGRASSRRSAGRAGGRSRRRVGPSPRDDRTAPPCRQVAGARACPRRPCPPPPSPGYALLEANTYGEQGLRLTLREWLPSSVADAAASGWGGDRVALYAQGDRGYAAEWLVRFDEAAPGPVDGFAARCFAAIGRALPKLGHVTEKTGVSACVERSGNGVLAVKRAGRDVVLVLGAVDVEGGAWRASMTCKVANEWAEEGLRVRQ